MLIYVLNLFLIIAWMFFNKLCGKQEKIRYIISWGIAFQLLLVMVLKADFVGTDLPVYSKLYIQLKYIDWRVLPTIAWDLGYTLFSKFMAIFISNVHYFYCLIYCFLIIAFRKYIKENSDDIPLSFWLFITLGMWGQSFYVLRQYIAIGICLYALSALKKRKLLLYIFYIICAALFHKTALVLLILYPMNYIRLNRSRVIAISGGLFLLLLSNGIIFDVIVKILPNSLYLQKYSDYESGSGYTMLIIYILLLLWVMLINNKEVYEKYCLDIWMLFCGCAFQIMSINLALFNRVALYFFVNVIVLLPNLLKYEKNIYWRTCIKCLIYVISAILYLRILQISSIVPYQFIWNEG